jgi:hypothetical protein
LARDKKQVHEHADASHPVGLLRLRIKEIAEPAIFQEIASSHCLPQG